MLKPWKNIIKMWQIIHKHIWGKVRRTNQRGGRLGFPTANINLRKKIPEGIYISSAKIRGKNYPALTFIGKAETFGEIIPRAESYILDFKQNIYGVWISIRIIKKIRDNQKFDSVKNLIAQMKQDEIEARKYFAKIQ